MHNLEIYVIMCYKEIYLNGIPAVGNLTEINLISETHKLSGNVTEILTEILTEMLNMNITRNSVINGITGYNPEILKRNRNSGQNPRNSGQCT